MCNSTHEIWLLASTVLIFYFGSYLHTNVLYIQSPSLDVMKADVILMFLKVNILIWNIAFGIQYPGCVHDPDFAATEKLACDVNGDQEGVNNKLLSNFN